MCRLAGLALEITRKCNLKCSHCLRGEAQNVTISTVIIDKLFEDVSDCTNISFSGGESLLELDMIEYFINKVINSTWNLKTIQMTTNGTILNPRIIEIFEKLCKRKGTAALLRVSDDAFHDINKSKSAYQFYLSLAEKVNRELGWLAIEVKFTSESPGTYHILYSGRAIDFINSNKRLFVPLGNIPIDFPYSTNHRVKIVNDTIHCSLELSANGNLNVDEERDYLLSDKLTFGNILDCSILDLVKKHNDNCLLGCNELSSYYKYGVLSHITPNISEGSKKAFNYFSQIQTNVVETRKIAHKKFEYVPMQDLITYLPMPLDISAFPVVDIFNEQFNAHEQKASLLIWARINQLFNANEFYIYPKWHIGNKADLFNCEAFKTLDYLNQEYKYNRRIARNDKVFICDDKLAGLLKG